MWHGALEPGRLGCHPWSHGLGSGGLGSMRHGQSPAVSDRRRFGKRSESRPPGDSRSGLRRKRALVLSSKRTSTRSDRLFILPQAPARPCLWVPPPGGVVVERGTHRSYVHKRRPCPLLWGHLLNRVWGPRAVRRRVEAPAASLEQHLGAVAALCWCHHVPLRDLDCAVSPW